MQGIFRGHNCRLNRFIYWSILLCLFSISVAAGTSSAAVVTPKIAAGEYHTVALMADGRVKAWGDNRYGQLGNGTTTSSSTPVTVTGLGGTVTAIAAGRYHTVALMEDGSVKAWGYNSSGQLGNGITTSSSTPVTVTGLDGTVTAIAAGANHTVALMSDGSVKGWGNNGSGQLGNGTNTSSSSPVAVTGLGETVTAIAAGSEHTLALMSEGSVKAWGLNYLGQLGNGTTTGSNTPVTVNDLGGTVIAIAAGRHHNVAFISDGSVKTWGYGSEGQLGNGTTTSSSTPVTVTGLGGTVTSIAAGGFNTVAVTSDGSVKAWGSNNYSQLGNGTPGGSSTPVTVTGLGGTVTTISPGQDFMVALLSDGSVKTWGANQYGQLGNGTTISSSTPVAVTGLGGTVNAITGHDHTVALMSDGSVKSWGYNTNGQLGNGTITSSSTPVTITGLTGPATAIAAGYSHTVALMSDGSIRAWGSNSNGQLGNGTTTYSSTPVTVTGLDGTATAIAAGFFHTVALMSDGSVKAWGRNLQGQLGNGTTTSSSTPVTVTGLGGTVTAIAAGSEHTLALMSDGSVKAWGDNNYYGQLGNGTTVSSSTPVTVTGLGGTVTAIAAGYHHTVALMTDGSVKTWGNNFYGQLGNGTTTSSSTPVTVTGLGGTVISIAAGDHHTLALMSDGSVKAWGYNHYGQLGNGTTMNSSTPLTVTGQGGIVTAVAGGSNHTLALLVDGSVEAWGYNRYGQLGNGMWELSPSTPVINLDNVPPAASADRTSGTYINSVTVTLSCSDNFSGCAGIYYTTDGSIPTTASLSYSAPLTFYADTALKFMASDTAGNFSDTQTLTYTVLPSTYPVTVTFPDNGSGTVALSTGETCSTAGGGCSESLDRNTVVSLSATAATGSFFSGWSGCDTVANAICAVTMNLPKYLQAFFTSYRLLPIGSSNYNLLGLTGSTGTIPLSGATFDLVAGDYSIFGNTASMLVQYDINTIVTGNGSVVCQTPVEHGFTSQCTLTPESGWHVASVSGCGGSWTGGNPYSTGPMTDNCTVSVQFNPVYQQLNVTVSGTGVVHSSPSPDINCSFGTCAGSYLDGSDITLTPAVTAGSTFSGWSGCDAVIGDQCRVTLNRTRNVTATFTVASAQLNVLFSGTGSGAVFIQPTNPVASCTGNCSQSMPGGTMVGITPRPAAGSLFAGWTGCDTVQGSVCIVNMTGAKTVTTTFKSSSTSPGFIAIAGGYRHTVGLRNDGSVWAWGGNWKGQIGDGTTTDRMSPVRVSGLSNVTAIAAGYNHTVALKSDGTVWIWGDNSAGQVGDGTSTDIALPKQVAQLTGIVGIAAGGTSSMALKDDGTVWAWGSNYFGQLGDGTTTTRYAPVQVTGLTGVTGISLADNHALALKKDGTVWSWGSNDSGQLGDGTVTGQTVPVQVTGISGMIAVSAGWYHSVALKNDGTVFSWGSNFFGQLGDHTQYQRPSPVQAVGITGIIAVAAGDYHTVALKSDGTVWTWGSNESSQLGYGPAAFSLAPQQVLGVSGIKGIAVGNFHSLSLKGDGTIQGWGFNISGQLGDGTTTNSTAPIQLNTSVRLTPSSQPYLFYQTLSAAFAGTPSVGTATLDTWQKVFVENVVLNKPGATLTVGSAYDPSFVSKLGPTVIQGRVTISAGTLIAENMIIR